jgi:hypothetical protein
MPGAIANISYTYLWSNGATTSQINNIGDGLYSVQVTNNQGCYEIAIFTLSDPYFISFGGIAAPTCPGGTNGMATLNSSGCPCMFSACIFLWENGVTTKPNNNLIEGWNSVQITHPNGCVVLDSVLIPLSPALYDSTQIANVTCEGYDDGIITIFSSIPASLISYNWSNGDTNNPVDSLSPGTYQVIITDTRPCTDTLLFSINEPTGLLAQIITQNVLCFGDSSGALEFVASGGNGGYIYHLDSISSLTPLFYQLSTGQYTLTVSDVLGCTSTAQTVVITQPQPLLLNLNSSPESAVNSYDGTASANVSGGTAPYTITWSNQQSGVLINSLIEGWYTVVVNDANGCDITDSIYVGMLNLNNLLENEISAYPNPVKDQLTFSSESEKVYLFDSRGALVLEDKNKSIINVAHLTGGIYTLHLITNERASIMRLVKLNE